MLKKFATTAQVERAVGYINVKETDRKETLRGQGSPFQTLRSPGNSHRESILRFNASK